MVITATSHLVIKQESLKLKGEGVVKTEQFLDLVHNSILHISERDIYSLEERKFISKVRDFKLMVRD